jgi:ATP-binding cassette subfamily F protein 3
VLTPKKANRPSSRNERELRKEISTLEKTIARLDDQKRDANSRLMQSSDPQEALRLHEEVESLSAQLTQAEERWCALQEELGEW